MKNKTINLIVVVVVITAGYGIYKTYAQISDVEIYPSPIEEIKPVVKKIDKTTKFEKKVTALTASSSLDDVTATQVLYEQNNTIEITKRLDKIIDILSKIYAEK